MELITDPDMHQMVAKNMRGGISNICHRQATSNAKELHDRHNLYPLTPEHVEVTDDMLSPFQLDHLPSIRGSVRKLVPNLHNNKKYGVHYWNLQLYVSLRMKI